MLAIIIVSWNVRELLRCCIETVSESLAGGGIAAQIVVVDNASADGSAAMVRATFPGVALLESGGNLGFAGGNNLGLRWLLRQDSPPDAIMLLNPDTEVVGDALPRLVAFLAATPDAIAVGPRLRYGDGSQQSSRRRFPTPALFLAESTPLERLWPDNPWARRYRMAGSDDDATQDVGWLVGAALLVRRSAIERGGLLDAGFALYSEEVEWQLRLRRAGGRIVYLPDAVITHFEGRSSGQVELRRLILFHTSRLRYASLVWGEHTASIVRCGLLAIYGAEWAAEAGKWLIGHRRALRAERVAAYGALLRALRS